MVSLDPTKTDYVVPANLDNGSRLVGVAVATNDSLLAVNPNQGNVQVATSGSATVLVSTLNGPIKTGDEVAVSPFNGIGAKAQPGSHYIGLAENSFNTGTAGGANQEVTNQAGKTSKLYVGYVKVTISIGLNNTGVGSQQLSTLQRLGKSLTGHTVSNLRIILSLVIAIGALLTLITLIYGAIYGSIISVGRNPLAKHAIFRTLGSVLGMAVITAVTAALLVIFLLR